MGRPPLGKVAMTSTERSHRHRAKTQSPPLTDAARKAELTRLRTRIAALEAEITRPKQATDPKRLADLEKRNVALEAEIARLRTAPPRPAERAASTGNGKAADGRAYKLLRMLDSSNDNEILKAARTLAASYDLRALGTALDDAHTKQQKKPPPPPPIDWPKVEATIKAYAEGKTKVIVNQLWKAIHRAMPELAKPGADDTGVHECIIGTLSRLGFARSQSGGTFSRPAA